MKIVLVTWHDAWGDNEFHDHDELDALHHPKVAQSVGFLLKRDKTGITLCGCVDDKTYDRVMFIPHGMVKSVVTIRR